MKIQEKLICQFCGKEFDRKCSKTQHIPHCHLDPNSKWYKENHVLRNCLSCGKEFFSETKNQFYCSISCANKRIHSEETKEKIKQTLVKNAEEKIKNNIKICKECGNEVVEYKYYSINGLCRDCASKKVKCQYCGKEFTRGNLNQHEKSCKLNPNQIHNKRNRRRTDCRDGYIYCITNLINNKKYVGKHVGSPDLSKSYYGSGLAIKAAINKYGKENFSKEILEIIEDGDLNKQERYWISKLNTFSNGYNLTEGGDGGPLFKGKHHSKETKEKLGNKHKNNVF